MEDDADDVCSSSSSVVDGVSASSSMSGPSIILSYALKSKRRKDTLAVSLAGASLDAGLDDVAVTVEGFDILYGRSVGRSVWMNWGLSVIVYWIYLYLSDQFYMILTFLKNINLNSVLYI